MKLDAFQKVAVGRCVDDLDQHGDALLVATTGAGKTVMMAAILRLLFSRERLRVLVLQHTVTLWEQNARELTRMLEGLGLTVGVLGSGKAKNLARADIVVGTLQTLGRAGSDSWLDLLDPFDMLVIDEAHHAAAPQYAGLTARLKAATPRLKVLGMTATPQRADGKALAAFTRVSHHIPFEAVIRAGRVVPPRVFSADLDAIEPPGYDSWVDGPDESWAATMRKKVVLDEIVRHHLDKWEGRAGVYFCPTVKSAEELAADFRAAGLRAACVEYNMRPKAVRETLAALDRGELDVVTNATMLTEGFNCPRVALIGLTRGFASKALLVQAIGRGVRAFAGKCECLVLDFVKAVPRHGDILPGLDIFGRGGGAAGRGGAGGGIEARPVLDVTHVVMREVDALDGLMARLGEIVPPPADAGETADGAEATDGSLRTARSRKEALALGLPTYFTGKPCSEGHVAERRASEGSCVECLRLPECRAKKAERDRLRRQDPEVRAKEAELHRRWRRENPENRAKKAERARRWRENPENRAKNAENARLWRLRKKAEAQHGGAGGRAGGEVRP